MSHLILSAFCSLLLVVVFKLFGKYQIESFQAIVANYIVCVVTGCLVSQTFPFEVSVLTQPWFPLIFFLGVLFIGGFYIASMTVQHFGVAIASVAQRMSLVISVSFAIVVFSEPYNAIKIVGILLAIFAVVLINIPPKKSKKLDNQEHEVIAEEEERPAILLLYPLAIFVISGFIEIILQYLNQIHRLDPTIQCLILFGAAGSLGVIALIFALITKRVQLKWKNALGGVFLGIPNYFSIYFLLLALENGLDGSVAYPISNILIVGSSALVGYFLFKERLSKLNIVGVCLAISSIYLIAFFV